MNAAATRIVIFVALMAATCGSVGARQFKLAMTEAETETLGKYMAGAQVYAEYGCGGSTMLACESGVRKIYSFDSHPQWVEKMQRDTSDVGCNANIRYVNIGPVKMWGFPEQVNKTAWAAYAGAIKKVDEESFDLVLIDGRWRLACFFNTLQTVGEDTLIAVHDFTWRPAYHALLPYVEVVEQVGSLVVVRKKADVPHTRELIKYLADWYLSRPE